MASPGTILLIGGAALIAFLSTRRKKTMEPTVTPAPTPTPDNGNGTPTPGNGNGGGGTPSGGGKYVGAPGYDWAHKAKWPGQIDFQNWLSLRGYQPGFTGNVLDAKTQAAVKLFQGDFNVVRKWLVDVKGLTAQVSPLTVDGKIGDNTIKAMYSVDWYILKPVNDIVNPGTTWKEVVSHVKAL